MKHNLIALIAGSLLALPFSTSAKEVAGIDVNQDVVYGHKMGLAMTFDVLTPKKPNGAAAVFMVSGGWVSRWAPPEKFIEDAMEHKDRNSWGMLLDHGFTVFLVRHGSSPMFKVPDAVDDVRRAIRFIRLHAEDYEIDPERIGVFGGSAGGHLALMLGTTSDAGDAGDEDEVNRVSNRVAAVVAYFPPTDLEGYIDDERFPALHFEKEQSPSVSPIFHVTPDDPPTLLLHGAKDTLVPLDHSENILAAFQKAGVPSKLITFPDADHGFGGEDEKTASVAMVEWFESHLNSNLSERFAGIWDVVGSRSEGVSNESVITISIQDGKLAATSTTASQGDITLDKVYIAGNRIVLAKTFPLGATVTIDAVETARGKLAGTWNMKSGGVEQVAGDWEATMRQPLELDGTWRAVGESDDGQKHQATLEFSGGGANLSGVVITEDDERSPLKEIKVDHKTVSFHTDIQDGDAAMRFRVNAGAEEDGSLKGSWEAVKDDEVVETGKWTAVKAKAPEITGEWALELTTGGESRDYGLKIAADGEALNGTLISPRSGEHKCKSVEFSDGTLTIHVVRDYNGNEVELKYEAKFSDEGKLEGKFAAVGFEEQFNGTWKGTKK